MRRKIKAVDFFLCEVVVAYGDEIAILETNKIAFGYISDRVRAVLKDSRALSQQLFLVNGVVLLRLFGRERSLTIALFHFTTRFLEVLFRDGKFSTLDFFEQLRSGASFDQLFTLGLVELIGEMTGRKFCFDRGDGVA
jgi:hypothetical protein